MNMSQACNSRSRTMLRQQFHTHVGTYPPVLQLGVFGQDATALKTDAGEGT